MTGSMHLVVWRDKKILLDCGLYQGKRKIAFEKNRSFPIDVSDVDAVILSHAHIDHSGKLPSLVKAGYRGPIYATGASRDLAAFMLLDSAKIQKYDVKYVNKKRRKNGQQEFEALYTTQDAAQTLKQFRTIEYEHGFSPIDGVTCRFHVAGHMLGAAIVELVLPPESGDGPPVRLVFSGDIGRPGVPILRDPVGVKDVDYLIMEATYGDRIHPKGLDAKKELLRITHETYNDGGKLIIPAFSVGRTQEIVYRMDQLAESGQLPPMQVFVDSPLAVNATDVFRSHVECFDDEMVNAILEEEDGDPLAFENLHYIRRVEDSKALNDYPDPCVIISASGMCEGGRILHHLKNNIENPTTRILFAGYQAPNTLGRILLDKLHEEVKIYGEPYQMNAQVAKLEGSSGHADQSELVAWAEGISKTGDLKKIALVHCEMDSASALKKKLERRKIGSVMIPEPGHTMEMD